jgi:signal transduction histidine kinase
MGLSNWLRPPWHLLALFTTVTIVPAAVLVWLGWQFISRDRAFEQQQTRERVESAADRVATGIQRALDATERGLPAWFQSPPGSPDLGASGVAIGRDGFVRKAGAPLPFVPGAGVASPAHSQRAPGWAEAETLEYRQRDFAGAARAFERLAAVGAPHSRAAALVALARNLRALGRRDDALEAYRTLQTLPDARVVGEPADLIARAATCTLLHELGRRDDLVRAAEALAHDLARGHWTIDRGTFEMRVAQLRVWVTVPVDDEAVARAAAIETFWRERVAEPNVTLASGRRSVVSNDRGVLLLWQSVGDEVLVFGASADYLRQAWRAVWDDEGVQVSLSDTDGRVAFGNAGPLEPPVASRSSAETGLPWNVRVTGTAATIDAAGFATRRRLLAWGLGLLVVLIPAGGYVVWRAVQKELAVARLQADFVSAVSHEFRTPLTSMAHLTERLQRDRSIPDDRKRQYYDVLARDTDRLRRFVESLLDFGRMEAGAAPARLQTADLGTVVTEVVNDFRSDAAAGRHEVVVQTNGPLPVNLDRDTFGRALWNLLDNAAKYSHEEAPIMIDVARDGSRAAVRVRDRGRGVPVSEQRQIFQKFVRGTDASTAGVRGTGVGLAMVDHIVHAHGGEVRLESVIGQGSTFTVVLPLVAASSNLESLPSTNP